MSSMYWNWPYSFASINLHHYLKPLVFTAVVFSLVCKSFAERTLIKALNITAINNADDFHSTVYKSHALHIIKREFPQTIKCSSKEDCSKSLPGSLCINGNCSCPQGYLPNAEGNVGCFQGWKNIGEPCNSSSQCHSEQTCQKNVCSCPDGAQLYQVHGSNMCLLWHRPIRLIERCRNIEDCIHMDVNSVCRKRWCQCSNGYQLFQTMLFGFKHKCFKTYKVQCNYSIDCAKLSETSDQFCICQFGFCHCTTNSTSSFDIYGWGNERTNWYQRWKKDLILATRLLFITVILFFVPCFVYVTLGVRQRSRQLFSHAVQPSRSTASHISHYAQRRGSQSGSQRRTRGESRSNPELHNVEIALSSRGINSRLIGGMRNASLPRDTVQAHDSRRPSGLSVNSSQKEEDPPPSYEEIMRIERIRDTPPPPYQEL